MKMQIFEISFSPNQNGKDQQNNQQQMLEGMGAGGSSFTAGRMQTALATLQISVKNPPKAKNKP